MDKELVFRESKTESELQDIYNFNVQVFTDSQDFNWSLSGIKNELKDGWKVYSVDYDDDIVAALFVKKDGNNLYTKNTSIKLAYQGNGFSHQIKTFYEELAKAENLDSVFNYCPVDNFRMIALNERHDYEKTGNTLGGNERIIEWKKTLS